MSKALEDISAERQRQVSEEGWTPEHDDNHHSGDLVQAAVAYAAHAPADVDFLLAEIERLRGVIADHETLPDRLAAGRALLADMAQE